MANLNIAIDINLEGTDFLDLDLNLQNEKHGKWRKQGDKPQYINTRSNHLPNIIKQIPTMVDKRLSKFSSNKEIKSYTLGTFLLSKMSLNVITVRERT